MVLNLHGLCENRPTCKIAKTFLKSLIHHFGLSLVKFVQFCYFLFIFGLKNGRSSGGNITVNTLSQFCKAHIRKPICFLWRYAYFPSDMFFLGLQIKLQYKSCFLNLSSPNQVKRNLYKVWVNFCHRFSILKRHSDKTVKGFDDNQDQKPLFPGPIYTENFLFF